MACGLWKKPTGFGTVILTHVSVLADSTGTHSLYTTYQDYEIMFHVSTLLPYTPNNRQQVSGLLLAQSWAEGILPPPPCLLAAHLPNAGCPGTDPWIRWRLLPLALENLCTMVTLFGT
jgi:hypothetical protein